MARILFGWDSGYGTGYVERLLMVADQLAAEGHQPIFAIRDLIVSAALLAQTNYPVLQAPVAIGQLDPVDPLFRPGSFADLLAVANFNEPVLLLRLMRAWDMLLQAAQPSLAICEYAPLLSLATFGRVPTIAMGHGYIMPPPELDRLPIFDYAPKPHTDQDQLLRNIHEVQAARNLPAPPTLPAFLGGVRHFVTAFSETDPYASMRVSPAVGPLELLPPLSEPPASARFYAYLSADYRHLRMVLQGLVESGVPGSCYIKRITPQLRQYLTERGIAVLDQAPRLEKICADSTLIVHHGGTATLHAAFGAGRPQILWPQVGDQRVSANTIDSLGLTVDGPQRLLTPKAVADAVKRMVADGDLAARCKNFAENVRLRGEHGSLARILDAAHELLATS